MPHSKKMALLVDDDDVCLMALSNVLENIGIRAHTTSQAEKAVLLAKTHNYDLILLDLHMPTINGLELANIIQQDDKTTTDKIFILTGDETDTVFQNCKNNDSFRIISKPLDRNLIINFLSESKNVNPLHINDSEPLASIQGIDVCFGIKNFMGYKVSFYHTLRAFPDYGLKFIYEYSTYLKAKNFKECKRLAHSIKGSSLMIGAKEINSIAIQLEKECNNPSNIKNVTKIFNILKNNIEHTSNNITNYFKNNDST